MAPGATGSTGVCGGQRSRSRLSLREGSPMRWMLVLFVVGCGSKPAPMSASAPPPAVMLPSPANHVFEVRVNVTRKGGEPILPNSVVPTGTHFEVVIELDEPAHIYVGGISAVGKPYLVLPEPASSAVIPAGYHRLPAKPTKWLVLEPPSGQERMFVIASRQPLAEVDQILAQTMGELPLDLPTASSTLAVAVPAAPKAASAELAVPVRQPGKPPSPHVPARTSSTFTPDLVRTVAMTPRGELKPRWI